MATPGGQMPMFWSKKNWKISFFVSSNGSISGVIDKVFFYFLYIYFKFSFLVECLLPNEEPTPMRWIRGLSLNYLKIWIPSYLKAPPPLFWHLQNPQGVDMPGQLQLFGNLFGRDTIMLHFHSVFVAVLSNQMVQIEELLTNPWYFGSFRVKIWVLDPLWWSYRETLPIVCGFILNEYYNALF